MVNQYIIVLLGNDGCGKSTLCEMINAQNNSSNDNSIIAIERSNGLGEKYGIDPSIIDKLTLEYTFDAENFNKIKLPNETINNEKIYWVILDCEIDTILQRLKSRTKRDIWETRKALIYFQQRFRHLGAHFGIPYIDTTSRTLEQVYNEILNIVKKHSDYYQYYRQMCGQTISYNCIQECDIENKLYQIVSSFDVDKITNLPEYAHEFDTIDTKKLYVRWCINNYSIDIDQKTNLLHIGDYSIPITGLILKLIIEGESKKVYKDVSGNPFTTSLAFIILKSTIYSHSMQATGEIQSLGMSLFVLSLNKQT